MYKGNTSSKALILKKEQPFEIVNFTSSGLTSPVTKQEIKLGKNISSESKLRPATSGGTGRAKKRIPAAFTKLGRAKTMKKSIGTDTSYSNQFNAGISGDGNFFRDKKSSKQLDSFHQSSQAYFSQSYDQSKKKIKVKLQDLAYLGESTSYLSVESTERNEPQELSQRLHHNIKQDPLSQSHSQPKPRERDPVPTKSEAALISHKLNEDLKVSFNPYSSSTTSSGAPPLHHFRSAHQIRPTTAPQAQGNTPLKIQDTQESSYHKDFLQSKTSTFEEYLAQALTQPRELTLIKQKEPTLVKREHVFSSTRGLRDAKEMKKTMSLTTLLKQARNTAHIKEQKNLKTKLLCTHLAKHKINVKNLLQLNHQATPSQNTNVNMNSNTNMSMEKTQGRDTMNGEKKEVNQLWFQINSPLQRNVNANKKYAHNQNIRLQLINHLDLKTKDLNFLNAIQLMGQQILNNYQYFATKEAQKSVYHLIQNFEFMYIANLEKDKIMRVQKLIQNYEKEVSNYQNIFTDPQHDTLACNLDFTPFEKDWGIQVKQYTSSMEKIQTELQKMYKVMRKKTVVKKQIEEKEQKMKQHYDQKTIAGHFESHQAFFDKIRKRMKPVKKYMKPYCEAEKALKAVLSLEVKDAQSAEMEAESYRKIWKAIFDFFRSPEYLTSYSNIYYNINPRDNSSSFYNTFFDTDPVNIELQLYDILLHIFHQLLNSEKWQNIQKIQTVVLIQRKFKKLIKNRKK